MWWMAFIYPYLWDTTQLRRIRRGFLFGCELLSFIRLFGIQHNSVGFDEVSFSVVNCFHLSVSLGYNTTHDVFGKDKVGL